MLLILLLLADRVLPKVSSRGSNIEGVRVGSRAESVTGIYPVGVKSSVGVCGKKSLKS